MKERIDAGKELETRSLLNGYMDADVLFDVTRPLGTFLAELEHDPDGKWNRFGLALLREALHSNRWKQPELELAAGEFLKTKYDTSNPLRMYAAFRIWNGYLLAREFRNMAEACDRFIGKISHFTMAFQQRSPLQFDSDTGRPQPFSITSRTFGSVPSEDTRLDLWFPDKKRMTENVSAYASLYSLITYYLNRLNDWGLCFRKCKVCGRIFLAKSQRYELCGDKCRKKQAQQNKRGFDERARENNHNLLYKNEC